MKNRLTKTYFLSSAALSLALSLSLVGCGENQKPGSLTTDLRERGKEEAKADASENAPLTLAGAPDLQLSTQGLQTYARQLVSVLAGRPLKRDERKQLAEAGEDALPNLLNAWMGEAFFEKSFRGSLETMLGTSGSRDGIDFNLPGNLAAYLVKEKLPIANLLTADFCVNDKMQKITCDTGAPYTAGVIATRGYLVAHNSRFNLGRAIAMINVFTCKHYPMSGQDYVPKEKLIPNFRIATEDEAKSAGATGFGNGATCYVCHGQFSAHTQVFVKFDDKGLFKPEASGLQDAKLEFGRGESGTFASHFVDKNESGSEFGNFFGTEVSDMAGAAKAITENPAFLSCMAKNAMSHALGLDSEASNKISEELLKQVSSGIPTDEPKVPDVYRTVLTHPLVMKAFARGVAQ